MRIRHPFRPADAPCAVVPAPSPAGVQLVGELPPIEARWSGAWAETPDLVPLAGPVPGRDRVWVAGGYSGHGNVLGFACGDLVARALAGESPSDLALFDPSRFNATRV